VQQTAASPARLRCRIDGKAQRSFEGSIRLRLDSICP
jgi:hypothetical protein